MKHKSRDASPLMRFWKRKLLPLLFWLAVWQGTVWLLMAVKKMPTTALVLPSPLLVAETLAELVGTAVFWQTALASLGRIFSGLLVGVLLGTAAAVCTSAWEWADCILSPAVRVIRATPVASFILLVILWFPTGQVPVVVSALMVLPVVWGNVKRGVAQTDPLLLEAARVYRSRPVEDGAPGLYPLGASLFCQRMPYSTGPGLEGGSGGGGAVCAPAGHRDSGLFF